MSDSKEKQILTDGITRRDLFKGSAIALGSAAVIGAVPNIVSEAHAQSADRNGCPAARWEQPVKAIPAAEIKNTVETDVLVIGSGLAGLCTAISAKENGVKTVTIIDKNKMSAARGIHIAAFGSKTQQKFNIDVNGRQIIREWVRWAQGRVNEELLWLWSQKSGACMDWMVDLVAPKGLTVGIWDQYYKGPDYTEYPVTHIFTDTKSKEGIRGNPPLVKALEEVAIEKGVKIDFNTRATQLIREPNGKVTGVIAGRPGNYTKYVAKNGVVLATGDYASDKEMVARYCPIASLADAQIYFPNKCNTGDGHTMAMQAGGAMQKAEPHAAVIHLEAGAMSYGFLHVNALGKRFKNEDVNTQSKSCSKLFEPGKIAWTVYDADGLKQVKDQMDKSQAGGLFYGQMNRLIGEKWSIEEEQQLLDSHVKTNKVMVANTIEELARKMGLPEAELKKTVERYNQMAKQGNDTDFGKRKELMNPIVKAPFYAGKLMATTLTMSGGLRTDKSLRVLDSNDKPIENLYVVGAAAGDFFAADYPTIVPGIGHGRCVTFGRLAGYALAGKTFDAVPSIKI